MYQFTIPQNDCLRQSIRAFHHDFYSGGDEKWKEPGTIENIICTLKNDIEPYPYNILSIATQQLRDILIEDLPEIRHRLNSKNNLTVCVVPRAKVKYNADQLLFRETVHDVVNRLSGFYNGINYIIRHTDTKTTHRAKWGYGGKGSMPYPGITKDTCTISDEVRGKDILLIDDLYTKTIDIDEDAIQALLDKGANSVVFYSVGKTVFKHY